MFNSKEACSMSGATYRQLDYWCKCGVIKDTAKGSGTRREFDIEDILALKLVLAIVSSFGQDKAQFIVTSIKEYAERCGYKGYAIIEYEHRGIWFIEKKDLEETIQYGKIISATVVNLAAVEESVMNRVTIIESH